MISPGEERGKFDELTAWTQTLGDRAFLHQHVVDAWAAQHAGHDTKPITIAFALIGLYLYLERGYSGREVQRLHMRLAQPHGRGPGRREWPRFAIPDDRGKATVADVMSAPEDDRARAVEQWCRSVWAAWNENHDAIAEWAEGELRESFLNRAPVSR